MFDIQKFAGTIEPSGAQFVDPTTARATIPIALNSEGYIDDGTGTIAGQKTMSISPIKATATPDILWYGNGAKEESESLSATAMGIVKAVYFVAGVVSSTAVIENSTYADWKRAITQLVDVNPTQ